MTRLTMIELFSGTGVMSQAFRHAGYQTFTIDNNPNLNPDLVADIWNLKVTDIPKKYRRPRVVWASPPCQKFSVCTIGKHWNTDHTPKTEEASEAMRLVLITLKLIQEVKPRYWFIENHRGKLRRMPFMQGLLRHTVTYCQYGDKNQKPTDIWTNCTHWMPRKPCNAGSLCHDPAPRGTHSTGIQGMSNATVRGMIPQRLCQELAHITQF